MAVPFVAVLFAAAPSFWSDGGCEYCMSAADHSRLLYGLGVAAVGALLSPLLAVVLSTWLFFGGIGDTKARRIGAQVCIGWLPTAFVSGAAFAAGVHPVEAWLRAQ